MELEKNEIIEPQPAAEIDEEEYPKEEPAQPTKKKSEEQLIGSEFFKVSKEDGIQLNSAVFSVGSLVGFCFEALENSYIQKILGIQNKEDTKKDNSYCG